MFFEVLKINQILTVCFGDIDLACLGSILLAGASERLSDQNPTMRLKEKRHVSFLLAVMSVLQAGPPCLSAPTCHASPCAHLLMICSGLFHGKHILKKHHTMFRNCMCNNGYKFT